MTRKPFTPTRSHPHRWCRPLHRWINILGTIVIIAMFVQNPITEAIIVGFAAVLGIAIATSRMGPGTRGRIAHATANTTRHTTHVDITVDRRWATIAATTDTITAAASIAAVAAIGSMGTDAYQQTHGIPPSIGIALAITGCYVTFATYAHWRATRPRPRRRVRIRVVSPATVTMRGMP